MSSPASSLTAVMPIATARRDADGVAPFAARTCYITESWRDRRNWFLRGVADRDGSSRAAFTRTSRRTTLTRLRDELEGAPTS